MEGKIIDTSKRIPIYKIEVSNCYTDNWLMFIPRIYISVSKWSFYMAITWFRIHMYVYLTTNAAKYLDNYSFSTPFLVFRRLQKQYKEKWDFQFFFLWMKYRHFFGKRKEYECSLKDCEMCKFTWKK